MFGRFSLGCGLAYFYTADPFALKYIALGDATIITAFGPLIVESTVFIHVSQQTRR